MQERLEHRMVSILEIRVSPCGFFDTFLHADEMKYALRLFTFLDTFESVVPKGDRTAEVRRCSLKQQRHVHALGRCR